MSLPAISASVETFFDHDEYCAAVLSADPATRDLEPLITSASDKLAKAVSARTAARRALNRETAVRDFTFSTLTSAVGLLERKARADFDGGERAAGYQRLFSKSPSQLAKTTIETRALVFETFVAEAESEDTPATLAKPVKAVSTAWAGYQAAFKRFTTAHAALAKAREKEAEAKQDNITALRKLDGKLTDRFPDDLRRVRSYSPPAKPARKAQPAPAPAVEQGPAKTG
jgi:hypothetical protein